ncbi:hypothetical protein HMPREF3086_04855 [Dietzia sp. HMSC21D01]|nr:hypothetical protein HMPREF3086_04855 [Dietzia sp. HMSC21D01]
MAAGRAGLQSERRSARVALMRKPVASRGAVCMPGVRRGVLFGWLSRAAWSRRRPHRVEAPVVDVAPVGGAASESRDFCQGHRPEISSSSDQLRNVRITTIAASTATLSNVGVTATVLMMSAGTRISWNSTQSPSGAPRALSRTRASAHTSDIPEG